MCNSISESGFAQLAMVGCRGGTGGSCSLLAFVPATCASCAALGGVGADAVAGSSRLGDLRGAAVVGRSAEKNLHE